MVQDAPDTPTPPPGAGDFAALARRVRDLESVLEVTRAMAVEEDLGRLLPPLAAACSKVLQAQRSSVWVIDPASGDLFTMVAEGAPPIRVPRGAGFVGAVAERNEPLLVGDAYSDPRFNPEVDRRTGFVTREVLCYPLRDLEGTRVVGVLQALNQRHGKGFGPADLELASALAAQAGVVLQRAALRQQALEKKRLQAEMDLARSIQLRLLPREAPRLAGLEIAGENRSATETSGDYFDYLPLAGGQLGLVVADVTGHGLGAALVMTEVRALVRALGQAEGEPSRLLAAANDLLCRDLEGGNFVTLCLACLPPAGASFSYASAGHDPPLIYRAKEDAFVEGLQSTGPLLGLSAGKEFSTAGPFPLADGDLAVFMTDGLFECPGAQDELFGKERVRAVIRRHAKSGARVVLGGLLEAVTRWAGDQPPRDDVTVVVVSRC